MSLAGQTEPSSDSQRSPLRSSGGQRDEELEKDLNPTKNRYVAAKEMARDYQDEGEGEERDRDDGVKPESQWDELVNQRIEAAIREGAFDNLPGAGAPQDLSPNPFAPNDRRLANDLLKNNDLAPSWISERNELLGRIAKLRQQIQDTALQFRSAVGAASDVRTERWRSRVAEWRVEADNLNRRIRTHNLQQPISHLEIFHVHLDEELDRLGLSESQFENQLPENSTGE